MQRTCLWSCWAGRITRGGSRKPGACLTSCCDMALVCMCLAIGFSGYWRLVRGAWGFHGHDVGCFRLRRKRCSHRALWRRLLQARTEPINPLTHLLMAPAGPLGRAVTFLRTLTDARRKGSNVNALPRAPEQCTDSKLKMSTGSCLHSSPDALLECCGGRVEILHLQMGVPLTVVWGRAPQTLSAWGIRHDLVPSSLSRSVQPRDCHLFSLTLTNVRHAALSAGPRDCCPPRLWVRVPNCETAVIQVLDCETAVRILC
ncbi:hypothetical protein NDU88_002081 [Pleurodeles waltl]|uniref:Uncharacterized protein n=1 Tax=Pleurodeles waltl TaxID=8319 RepID=A0AAV7KTM8_PLEWA|nr:hypothetical protein NDU88_002081 [Pleurodeles waltl]